VQDKRNLVLENGVQFECVDRFCYLGDMINAGGSADLASREASLKLKGKI